MTDNREAFEAWYDAQPDGRIQPWDVWQAAIAHERERCAMVCEDHGNAMTAPRKPFHAAQVAAWDCADAIRKGE